VVFAGFCCLIILFSPVGLLLFVFFCFFFLVDQSGLNFLDSIIKIFSVSWMTSLHNPLNEDTLFFNLFSMISCTFQF
jgi:hypothetical protein